MPSLMPSLPISSFENHYIATLNQMGFMLTKVDPFVQKFVDYTINNKQKWHLDVGAAYGIATLQCIKGGARIIANDLDTEHLNVIQSQIAHEKLHNFKACAGDIRKDINFSKESIASVLFSRVLHFFNGQEIIDCLKKLGHG